MTTAKQGVRNGWVNDRKNEGRWRKDGTQEARQSEEERPKRVSRKRFQTVQGKSWANESNTVSQYCWQLGVKGLFLHSHFPWRCVTGPPWSFVSLRCYVSHVGWTDRYRQRTEDRPVKLKGPHCLEACPTGQSTAAHWWGTEENSTRVAGKLPPASKHQQNEGKSGSEPPLV